eukprot:86834-Pelagomonas_calceolata.AAC.1
MELPSRELQARLDGSGMGAGKLPVDFLPKLPFLQQQSHPMQQQQQQQQQQQRVQPQPYSEMPLGARAPGSSSPTPAPPPPTAGTLPSLPPQQPSQDLQQAWRQLMMYAQV